MIKTINPFNGKLIKEYKKNLKKEIINTLEQSQDRFISWRVVPIHKRVSLMRNVVKELTKNKLSYAKLMTKEMGKPVSQGVSEVEKCIWLCEFYILNAEDFLADEIIETEATESFISYDPLGVVLAIMPWNYPFWQVFRCVVPTLLSGNTVILKHATNVTGCAMAIEKLFIKAGFPKECLQVIIADHRQMEYIIEHEVVKAVSLTGSELAGRKVAAIAGATLKKSVLELGGNNACIVWEDADLDKHMDTMVTARMQNTGQSCIAAKRFIVTKGIYDKFLIKFADKVISLKSGNPMKENTLIGVMAREDLAKIVEKQVKESVEKGAKIVLGGKRKGAYFEPTVLTNVAPGMPAFDDEIFGPVASIVKVKNKKESINMASKSRFGLGTMLFTKNKAEALKRTIEIEDGAFFINEMVKSDPRLPFGGTKASGFGRELSKEGMMEFVNKKTVYVQ